MTKWILSITCCGIIAAIIQTLLPKGMWKRIGLLAGGSLMMLAVMKPILRLDFDALSAELDRITSVQMKEQTKLSQQSLDLSSEIIREEYRAYILERAKELGINCEVSVFCEESAEGIPLPVRIIVTEYASRENMEVLLREIEHDFGITAELSDARGESGE